MDASEIKINNQSKAHTQPLDHDSAKLLMAIILSEAQKALPTGIELPFLSQVISKRIDVLKLPIKFTVHALHSINALCKTPGEAVILLVDCLTKFENQEVTATMLCEFYPWGFYNEKEIARIIDTEMKPRARKWSEIY